MKNWQKAENRWIVLIYWNFNFIVTAFYSIGFINRGFLGILISLPLYTIGFINFENLGILISLSHKFGFTNCYVMSMRKIVFIWNKHSSWREKLFLFFSTNHRSVFHFEYSWTVVTILVKSAVKNLVRALLRSEGHNSSWISNLGYNFRLVEGWNLPSNCS